MCLAAAKLSYTVSSCTELKHQPLRLALARGGGRAGGDRGVGASAQQRIFARSLAVPRRLRAAGALGGAHWHLRRPQERAPAPHALTHMAAIGVHLASIVLRCKVMKRSPCLPVCCWRSHGLMCYVPCRCPSASGRRRSAQRASMTAR